MIELVETNPEINVQSAEFHRLLGYPPGHAITGRAAELAEQASEWFRQHGRPWVFARQAERLDIADGDIWIDGFTFQSAKLKETLQRAAAHTVVMVAVSAGPEAEAEAQRLWKEEKPDEYFFMEMYASAVVEHLTTQTGARLCAWAEGQRMAVLPHYSPGYPKWDVVEQINLLDLVKRAANGSLPGPIGAFASGMLYPKKSLLAVFGVTRETESVRRLTDLTPCQSCAYGSCQYRRAAYGRAAVKAAPFAALNGHVKYATSPKALKRWAADRLSLEDRDGGIEAVFRYEGTTCTNMGRVIAFDYKVTLGGREERYPILEQSCVPAPGDTGHTFMCKYASDAQGLMQSISAEKPLAGQPLDDVIRWQRSANAAGCYCEPASRDHKWGLVLETIHYALAERERTGQPLLEQVTT